MSTFPSRKTYQVLLGLALLGAGVVMVLGIPATLAQQNATAAEAPIVPDRILVLFKGNSLPANADARITAAGGQMVRGIGAVGIAVATPTTTDAATLMQNLRNDSTILDADYDRTEGLIAPRSEEHTSELQSHSDLVCRLLLEKKKKKKIKNNQT